MIAPKSLNLKVLVTGATGFIGSSLISSLSTANGVTVRAAVRNAPPNVLREIEIALISDIDANTNWRAALNDIQVVVHTAARVHILDELEADQLKEYRRVNVAGTLQLARQSVEAGVGRFIFISSIKVNGERTLPDRPYSEDQLAVPQDPYAVSKLEAEQGLQKLAEETGLDVVIIRPPLVYGPGVKANFYSLMKWVNAGIPLPLGAIRNKRSFVSIDNLISLITTCIDHPKARNKIFLVSDGEDLSTTDLLERLGKALGKKTCLLPVPPVLLMVIATLFGKRETVRRLCDSLEINISNSKALLGWEPQSSVDEGFCKTARYFRDCFKN